MSKEEQQSKKKRMARRRHEVAELLKKQRYSSAELGHVLECSSKTALRVIESLREHGYTVRQDKNFRYYVQLQGRLQRVDDLEDSSSANRRRFYILFILYHAGALKPDQLERELSPEPENLGAARARDTAFEDEMAENMLLVSARTLQNDLKHLQEEGFISKQNGYYIPGKRLLQVRLDTGSLYLLATLLQEYGATSPYQVALSSVLNKIMAACPERASLFDNPYLDKLLARTIYLGKPFHVVSDLAAEQEQALLRERIDGAVMRRQRLRIEYGTAEKTAHYTVYPLKLCYNGYNDRWYMYGLRKLRSAYPQAWCLDLIRKLEVEEYHFRLPGQLEPDAMLEPAWGVGTGVPQKVKVRFEDIFNIKEKVRRQLRDRPGDRFYDDGTGWVLESYVSGLDEFRNWLRGFGAAVEVLEPPALRRAVYAAARRMLETYGEPLDED